MPALPPVPKTLRVTLRFESTDADQDIISRFFINYSATAPTDSDLVTFCTAVSGAAALDLVPLFPEVLSLTEVIAEDLTSSTSAVGSYSETVGGTRSGAPLSAGAAAVMQYRIPRRYRGGHPRGYWPFGTAADITTQDAWGSVFLAAYLTNWESFITAVQASGWAGAGALAQVNVSYFEGFTNHTYPSGRVRAIPTPRVTPLVDFVTDYFANPKVASQRRRNQQGK